MQTLIVGVGAADFSAVDVRSLFQKLLQFVHFFEIKERRFKAGIAPGLIIWPALQCLSRHLLLV